MLSGMSIYAPPQSKADAIALTKALELEAGKKSYLYTDSRYALATALVHGIIYQERRLLKSEGKKVKNKQEILNLLDACVRRPHAQLLEP